MNTVFDAILYEYYENTCLQSEYQSENDKY